MHFLLKHTRGFFCLTLLLVFSIIFCGCNINNQIDKKASEDNKIVVAVSIVPQETFVKAVTGELVDTIVLIPPGNSPTNYSPSPENLEQLSKSSIYFTIGVPTEKSNILPRLKSVNQTIKIVDLAAEVNRIYPDREFAPGQRDPHIWLSPKRVQAMIEVIEREIAEIDPANRTVYKTNAKDYQNKLMQLNTKIDSLIPPGKTFIVYHPAFGYFADDYQLKMVAIEENGKTATAKDIQNIIDLAKKTNIKTIFYQPAISSRQVETVAAEIAGNTKVIDPLAADYINNMEEMAYSLSRALK